MDMVMKQGHGHTAWTWTCSMVMDMQHGHKHAAWTWMWTRGINMDMQYRHAAWTMEMQHGQWTCIKDMYMQHR